MSDHPTPDPSNHQPEQATSAESGDGASAQPPTHQPYDSYTPPAPYGTHGAYGDYRRQPAPSGPAGWAPMGAPVSQPGTAGYIVALIAGIPVTLLMGLWTLASLLDGSLPGVFTLALGGAAATGSVFAIQDLSTGARGRRTPALLLTLIPAGLLALMFGFLFLVVALVLGGGNPN